MQVRHLAIDGSIVSLEADSFDLSLPVTATGWAVVPVLAQAHPFSTHPSGYASLLEAAAREVGNIEMQSDDEYALKGGTLRVVTVESQTSVGTTRQLAVGAWDDGKGCLTTSLVSATAERVAAVFDSLEFSSRELGVAIDGRVTARPRAPEVIKEIPGVGVTSIRPVTSDELRRLPRSAGARTAGGEAFRIKVESDAVVVLTETSIVDVMPVEGSDRDEVTAFVGELRIDWASRPA